MGSGPNGIILQKRYHWGLTPLVSFFAAAVLHGAATAG